MTLHRLLAFAAPLAAAAAVRAATSYEILVGTYTPKGGASQGIYALPFDGETGKFGSPVLAAEMRNPSFLALSPDGSRVYALDESGSRGGGLGGGVAAFALTPGKPQLRLINRQPTTGAATAHLALDRTGRMVATASYTGGQVAAFPIEPDGSLAPHSSWLTPHGKTGPDTERQEGPHPHSVTFSPDNRFAYVCDLGLDRIFIYRVNASSAGLEPSEPASIATAPGAGPRHSVFSADGKFFYVINELGGTITAYACDPATGRLTPEQTVATLPADFHGQNTCAEIQLHPNGGYIYGSNRGHDSLVVFRRDPESGGLSLVQIIPCGGKHPRHFALSPDGRWLVCANRDSANLVAFHVDPASGKLAASGETARVPQPVCVVFARTN